MEEAGPVLAMCAAFAKDHVEVKSGGCGSVVRNAEMKIVDPETGSSLPRNQPGEICIRGDQIMKGRCGYNFLEGLFHVFNGVFISVFGGKEKSTSLWRLHGFGLPATTTDICPVQMGQVNCTESSLLTLFPSYRYKQ